MLTRSRRSAVLIAFAVAITGATVPAAWAADADVCAAMNSTVHQRIDGADRAALLDQDVLVLGHARSP